MLPTYICIYHLCIQCIQLIDGGYVPEEIVTPVKDDATDEVCPLVDTVQPLSPPSVTGNDHSTDDEVSYLFVKLSLN